MLFLFQSLHYYDMPNGDLLCPNECIEVEDSMQCAMLSYEQPLDLDRVKVLGL